MCEAVIIKCVALGRLLCGRAGALLGGNIGSELHHTKEVSTLNSIGSHTISFTSGVTCSDSKMHSELWFEHKV